jgi:ribose transport system substrate-binding protein|tara:strand:+ start:146 stop:1354 length:1209 start_codon:yes stop_codon:yes gene_type:complete
MARIITNTKQRDLEAMSVVFSRFMRPCCLVFLFFFGFGVTGCNKSNVSSPAKTQKNVDVPRRFIFITNGDDPYFDVLNAGLQTGAEKFALADKGLEVVMEKNNATAQGQIDRLRQLVTQADVAGVAISVIQAENVAIVEEMKRLTEKGVSVITVDGDINQKLFSDGRPYYIGTDNSIAGRLLGTAGKKVLESRGITEGDFIQFTGFTDNDNARARMDGCREAIGASFREVDRMADSFDHSRARDNVRTALVNHPDVKALVGIWAYNAPAIAEVVAERGVRDQVSIFTFDAAAQAIEHMANGNIDCMIVQNPFEMGVQTVRLLLAMQEGQDADITNMFPNYGQPGGDKFTTGLRLIIPDAWENDEDAPISKKDLESAVSAGTLEVLSLSVFREWLKKYGLSSS